jgi:hypothetical protein
LSTRRDWRLTQSTVCPATSWVYTVQATANQKIATEFWFGVSERKKNNVSDFRCRRRTNETDNFSAPPSANLLPWSLLRATHPGTFKKPSYPVILKVWKKKKKNLSGDSRLASPIHSVWMATVSVSL